jgi:predicted dehydrogenase
MAERSSALTRRTFLMGAGMTAVGAGVKAAPGRVRMGQADRKVRIGIVGGNFGATFQWHLDPDCQVVAACDIREDALKRLVDVYGAAGAYRDFREFLKHPGMNAVGVFTPAPLHVPMAIAAMEAGKHVISAVPAGMTQAELEKLLACVKRTGLKYMMAETSYYHPEIIFCREARQRGEFGTIFYSESEYHHEGLLSLFFDENGRRTWRYGFPPMHYPTHCTGMILPVTGERLTEVTAIGWGDGHEILKTNDYKNPFWNTIGFFKTSGGHSARINVCWHIAAGGVERANFYGDRMSYIAARPEGSPHTLIRIAQDGRTVIDQNGYPQGVVEQRAHTPPDYFDRLPAPMRVPTGHGNSHTFLTHEFVRAIVEDRAPAVDIYESIAYTLPGIIAHQSALRGGERMKIKDYGKG